MFGRHSWSEVQSESELNESRFCAVDEESKMLGSARCEDYRALRAVLWSCLPCTSATAGLLICFTAGWVLGLLLIRLGSWGLVALRVSSPRNALHRCLCLPGLREVCDSPLRTPNVAAIPIEICPIREL